MIWLCEPILHSAAISALRPTQMTLGMREVRSIAAQWSKEKSEPSSEFLSRHMIPVIVGPKDRFYVIDHHHHLRALYEDGVKEVSITVVENLRHLKPAAFWFVLDNFNWMHPFDDRGRRRTYHDIPKSIDELQDDPFRSLAGELRRQGGFAKDTTPYSEFLWADYLRRRIKRKQVRDDFDQAMGQALELAKLEDADYLPGWCGPVKRRSGSR